MAAKIDPKLRTLIDSLRAEGFVLKGISRGFRVKLENGQDVDFYTLKANPSHVRARIKTGVSDDDKRERVVESIHRTLAQSLAPVADLYDFRLTKDMEGGFVYYAHLDFPAEGDSGETTPAGGEGADSGEAFELADAFVNESFGEPAPASRTAAADALDAPGEQEDHEDQEDQIDFAGFMEDDAEDDEEDLPRPEAVVDRLEAVDAKMLRQAMDSLCLPRSSNVRMVLTRLYRSAVDTDELSSSISVEAAKVSTEEDVAELKMIREMHSVDFLNPLIDLLWHAVKGDDAEQG